MEFCFETKYDQRGLTVMARAQRKTVRKKHSRRSHIFAWCVVALDVLLLALRWRSGTLWSLRGILTLVVGVILVLALLTEDRVNAFAAKKNMLPGVASARCVFTEEGYTSATEIAVTEFRYEAVQQICETADYFVFLLSQHHGQIYDKAALRGGTVEEFRTFITEKTGKPVYRSNKNTSSQNRREYQ